MLECVVEKHLITKVKELGGIAYKFTSPQRRSVPDRLVLQGRDRALRKLRSTLDFVAFSGMYDSVEQIREAELERWLSEIVAEAIHFVECKATGGKPTSGQQREHERLRALGFTVEVIDNIEEIDKRYVK